MALFNLGKLESAFEYFSKAVSLEPQNALFHRNLGELCRHLGRLEQALLCGKASSMLEPTNVDTYCNLGLVHSDRAEINKAITAYRKAVKLDPNHGYSWNDLGSALELQGKKKAALAAYEKAALANPNHAEAQNNKGAICSEEGRLDEAKFCFNAAISAKPDFIEAHYNLSSLKTHTPEDPHLKILEDLYAKKNSFAPSVQIRLSFAMGKALDDIGSHDSAFKAYAEGNSLQHSMLQVDENKAEELLKSVTGVFTKEFFEKRKSWRGCEDPKRVPIFIVGMPRSGTTLLEQILSSHDSVYGAGELVELNNVIYDATKQKDSSPYAEKVISLSEEKIRDIGDTYLKKVWKLSPNSRFITDKMPANFFYLGLIHLALPNAKIIHAMRDPMDSCFLCYSRLFNDTMKFTYDLNSLGNYYRRYITLMQH